MYGDYFLDAYLKKLNEKLDTIKEHILSGSINSLEDYRFSIGKLKSCQESIELLREMHAKIFETKTIYSGRDEDEF